MTIPTITRRYRRQQKLTLEGFGQKLSEELTGYSFSRQNIYHWESGRQRPEKSFLLLVAMRYGDWRRFWALDCLAEIQPEIFAPTDMLESHQEP